MPQLLLYQLLKGFGQEYILFPLYQYSHVTTKNKLKFT